MKVFIDTHSIYYLKDGRLLQKGLSNKSDMYDFNSLNDSCDIAFELLQPTDKKYCKMILKLLTSNK